MWNRWTSRRANLLLEFHLRRRSYRIVDRGGYESRNAATTHLLIEALSRCKPDLAASFSLPIYTDDFVRRPPTMPHLAYCVDDRATSTIAMPDFIFWSWPEVGIADYEATADAILAAGAAPATDPRLFWIGNPYTHSTRGRFLEIAASDPRICAGGVTWIKDPANASAPMTTLDNRYVSLPDHCRYRWLIDLQGRGYSGRLKLLLFSGRPLFVQQRRWKEYFTDELRPMVHYIPVREDLGDLARQLDWAEAHPAEAQQIAERAREFTLRRLRRSHAIDVLARQLVKISRGEIAATRSSETIAGPAQS
jgi:hypothetical protein